MGAYYIFLFWIKFDYIQIETDGKECCREKGVPEYCFGYCLTGTTKTKSRAITGFCEEWLKQIGQCRSIN